jgi:hypothetical protein
MHVGRNHPIVTEVRDWGKIKREVSHTVLGVKHADREYGHADARLVVRVEYGHVWLRTGLEQGSQGSGGKGSSNVNVVGQPGACEVYICTLVGAFTALAALVAFWMRWEARRLSWG